MSFQDENLKRNINKFFNKLSEQGVLDAILRTKYLEQLNRKMVEIFPGRELSLINKDSEGYFKELLRLWLLKNGAESYDNILNNPDWIQLFDFLLRELILLVSREYLKDSSGNIFKENESELKRLLCRAFPLANVIRPDEDLSEYRGYLKSVILQEENFGKNFQEAADKYFSMRIGIVPTNPFFIAKKMLLNITFSKLMMKRAIDDLKEQGNEVSFTTIEKKLKEIQPLYSMVVYVSLMMRGNAALSLNI